MSKSLLEQYIRLMLEGRNNPSDTIGTGSQLLDPESSPGEKTTQAKPTTRGFTNPEASPPKINNKGKNPVKKGPIVQQKSDHDESDDEVDEASGVGALGGGPMLPLGMSPEDSKNGRQKR